MLGGPGMKFSSDWTLDAPKIAVIVFVSAFVDAKVAVRIPSPFVAPLLDANVLLKPLLVNLTF